MSKKEQLLQRFLSKPKDFTYAEVKPLLRALGYDEIKTGKTSGSRIAFMNKKTQHLIRLHKPHPENILKRYQLDLIEDELKNMEVI